MKSNHARVIGDSNEIIFIHINKQVQGKNCQDKILPKSAQIFCMPVFSFRLSPWLIIASRIFTLINNIPYVINSKAFNSLEIRFVNELLLLVYFTLRQSVNLKSNFSKKAPKIHGRLILSTVF